MTKNSTTLSLILLLTSACATTYLGQKEASPPNTEVKIPPQPSAPPVSAVQQRYYKEAFPDGVVFSSQKVHPDFLQEQDTGHQTYVVVKNASGKRIGYLRDFVGAVTPDEDCACEPLKVTFIFDAQINLVDLKTPVPLTKYGHQEMSSKEMQRLISIAANPAKALLKITNSNRLIDAVTGATVEALKSEVVPKAGLVTWRISTLVQKAREAILNSPKTWDHTRFSQIMQEHQSDINTRLRAIARFIPTTQSREIGQKVFKKLVHDYIHAQKEGHPVIQEVEQRLLDPGLSPDVAVSLQLQGCYRLLEAGIRPHLVDQCARRLKDSITPIEAADYGRLQGSLNAEAGESLIALDPLQKATNKYDLDEDPRLHLRYGQALLGANLKKEGCVIINKLFHGYALLDGLKKSLQACENGADGLKTITDQKRSGFLQKRRWTGKAVAPIPLETMEMEPIDVALSSPDKVSVLVFFATWCHHCQDELPKIINFVKQVQNDDLYKDRVRVVGIRTAVEKESMSYEDFLSRFPLNFPVWTDPVMALAFSKFSRQQSLPTSIPTLAIVDTKGVVQFLFEPGTYRDTKQELLWAIQDVIHKTSPSDTKKKATKKKKPRRGEG
jgi:thiol-disulfide isomerase/thioredoxin